MQEDKAVGVQKRTRPHSVEFKKDGDRKLGSGFK